MKSFILLTGAAISLNIGLAHGTDIPSDVMRGHILPRLENADLFNYGSTDKANAAVVQQYKKDNRISLKAKFSFPSAQKVLEALTTVTNPEDNTITIGNVKWKLTANTRDFKNPALKGIHRESLLFGVVDGQETINCEYLYGDRGFINLQRSLESSQSKISTCSVANPGYETKLQMQKYSDMRVSFSNLKASNVPVDQDIDLICDQVPKQE